MRLYIFLCALSLITSCQKSYYIKPQDLARDLSQLPSYENHQALVVIFWQSSCPCVRRYEERVKKLYEKYEPLGVNFVYMSSNSNELFETAQKEYSNRRMPLKLLRDQDGNLARRVKAKSTPTALLIDTDGNIVYMGWIDNERREGERGRVAYLEDALKEYLANKPVSIKTSPMFGCAIL